ncbi:MAG: YciI family protein [Alphaproteobacteria bacterium]
MPYLIVTIIQPELAARREELREEHLGYLDSNVRMVLAAGAKLEDDGTLADGSFYLVDTDNADEARDFIDNDPYVKNGIVSNISRTRVRKGFFDRQRGGNHK